MELETVQLSTYDNNNYKYIKIEATSKLEFQLGMSCVRNLIVTKQINSKLEFILLLFGLFKTHANIEQ